MNATGPFAKVNPALNALALAYWHVHGYLSLVICTFGIITNIINIRVLTRQSMRTSINSILAFIAVFDILTMTSYVPFAVHFYLATDLHPTPERYSYGWTTFMAVHANVTLTTHATSLWLAVFMAVMRYIYLQTKRCLSPRSTCVACGAIFAFSVVIMIPNYLITGVYEMENHTYNGSIYRLNEFALGSQNPSKMALAAFWLYSIVGKFLPCSLITVFMGLLLRELHESAKRRKRLFTSASQTMQQRKQSRHKCTTTMLLAIIIMYMVTEFPQTFVVIMAASYENFFRNVYSLLADILDMAALVNNAINFVLYCAMSQQFREQLLEHSACVNSQLPLQRSFDDRQYESVNTTANVHHINGRPTCETALNEKSSP